MNTQRIEINGAEVFIPAYYQRVNSMPDDPENSAVYAAQTNYAACIVLISPVKENESLPRRFGKILFISTLEAYFEGKKELFKGPAIEQLSRKTGKQVVVLIDEYDKPLLETMERDKAQEVSIRKAMNLRA